ncbi:MAG: hypothetical protein RL156_888, partial [Bacteroidota bacterium]
RQGIESTMSFVFLAQMQVMESGYADVR